MPSLLITGVAGFLGRAFAREFEAQGWEVSGIDTISPENTPKDSLKAYRQLTLPSTELLDFIHQVKPDLIIHSAGRASVPLSFESPAEDFFAGPQVTAAVLESLRQYGQQTRLIFCSSAAVYGDPDELPIREDSAVKPISPYGYHKRMAELLCQQYSQCFGIPTAVMRIFSAYGPGLRRQVVYDTCRQAIEGRISLYGTGDESRDFIHAIDVAKAAYCIASSSAMNGDIYNVASGEETTIANIAGIAQRQHNSDVELTFRGEHSPGMPQRWQADIAQLRALGFSPGITLDKGVGTVLRWCAADAGQG